MELAQSLYEKHKILSYPRTDSRYLSTDLYGEIKEHIECCRIAPFTEMIGKIDIESIEVDKQYFNDKKVTDHHALIPTINQNMEVAYAGLTRDERNVFNAIVLSLIAIFYPEYQYSATEIVIGIDDYKFLSFGKTIRKLGYKEIYKEDDKENEVSKEEKQILPELKESASIKVDSQKILEGVTKPPKRYTVSTIVGLMEKYSIGTSATRAEIAKKLQNPKREFIKLDKGKYYSTELGKRYIEILPDKLKAPELTKQFEEQLLKINQGELTKDSFLSTLDDEIRATIEELKESSSEKLNAPERAKTICPICEKGNVIATQKVCFCSERTNGCQLAIFKTIAGKKLTDNQIMQLLTKGRTGKIKGFKGKKGFFDAFLVLDQEGKVKFEFKN